jgi:hypothetical protein
MMVFREVVPEMPPEFFVLLSEKKTESREEEPQRPLSNNNYFS